MNRYSVAFSYDFDLGFPGWTIDKICVIGMGGLIDMEKMGFESMICWTHIVTLNFDFTDDLDLEFSR